MFIYTLHSYRSFAGYDSPKQYRIEGKIAAWYSRELCQQYAKQNFGSSYGHTAFIERRDVSKVTAKYLVMDEENKPQDVKL